MNPDAPVAVQALGQWLAQAAGYFALASLTFLVVWKWGRERFEPRRVQKVRRVDGAQIRYEVWHSLVTLAVGGLSGLAIILLQKGGHLRLSMSTEGWAAWELVLVVVGLVAFNDLWFYGFHRLLHHRKLFRYVHAVHHRSVDTNPFTSYSFHAIEGFLLGAWTIPFLMLVPTPLPALGVTLIVGTANNFMSHLGYEFLPKWILRVPILRWMNTAIFHGLHHAKSHGNYGLFTRFWDRLFGTELPDYEARFLQRGETPAPTTATVRAASDAADGAQ